MFEREKFNTWIEQLKAAVQSEDPSPLLIPAAKGLEWIALSEGWEIPDWVYALANGNPNKMTEVIKAVRSFIKAEEGGEK